MLCHKNNTFGNTIFQISVNVPLNSIFLHKRSLATEVTLRNKCPVELCKVFNKICVTDPFSVACCQCLNLLTLNIFVTSSVSIVKYRQVNRDHLFGTCAKIFRKTNISYPLMCTCTSVCQGVRDVSFSENFAYALNE